MDPKIATVNNLMCMWMPFEQPPGGAFESESSGTATTPVGQQESEIRSIDLAVTVDV